MARRGGTRRLARETRNRLGVVLRLWIWRQGESGRSGARLRHLRRAPHRASDAGFWHGEPVGRKGVVRALPLRYVTWAQGSLNVRSIRVSEPAARARSPGGDKGTLVPRALRGTASPRDGPDPGRETRCRATKHPLPSRRGAPVCELNLRMPEAPNRVRSPSSPIWTQSRVRGALATVPDGREPSWDN
jgi:hypothetical protein